MKSTEKQGRKILPPTNHSANYRFSPKSRLRHVWSTATKISPNAVPPSKQPSGMVNLQQHPPNSALFEGAWFAGIPWFEPKMNHRFRTRYLKSPISGDHLPSKRPTQHSHQRHLQNWRGGWEWDLILSNHSGALNIRRLVPGLGNLRLDERSRFTGTWSMAFHFLEFVWSGIAIETNDLRCDGQNITQNPSSVIPTRIVIRCNVFQVLNKGVADVQGQLQVSVR